MAKRGPVSSPGDLGRILRDARLSADVTQEDLAGDLGVTRQYLSELETGKTSLHLDRIFAAMRLLDIRLEARWDLEQPHA
jgi:HTH-type transcriptional regulator/antitoxin HipB